MCDECKTASVPHHLPDTRPRLVRCLVCAAARAHSLTPLFQAPRQRQGMEDAGTGTSAQTGQRVPQRQQSQSQSQPACWCGAHLTLQSTSRHPHTRHTPRLHVDTQSLGATETPTADIAEATGHKCPHVCRRHDRELQTTTHIMTLAYKGVSTTTSCTAHRLAQPPPPPPSSTL